MPSPTWRSSVAWLSEYCNAKCVSAIQKLQYEGDDVHKQAGGAALTASPTPKVPAANAAAATEASSSPAVQARQPVIQRLSAQAAVGGASVTCKTGWQAAQRTATHQLIGGAERTSQPHPEVTPVTEEHNSGSDETGGVERRSRVRAHSLDGDVQRKTGGERRQDGEAVVAGRADGSAVEHSDEKECEDEFQHEEAP